MENFVFLIKKINLFNIIALLNFVYYVSGAILISGKYSKSKVEYFVIPHIMLRRMRLCACAIPFIMHWCGYVIYVSFVVLHNKATRQSCKAIVVALFKDGCGCGRIQNGMWFGVYTKHYGFYLNENLLLLYSVLCLLIKLN